MAPVLAHQMTSVGFNVSELLKSLHQWLFDVSNSLRHFTLFGATLDLDLAVDGFQKSIDTLSLTSMIPSGDKILGSLGGILPTLAGSLGRFVSAIGSVVVRVLLVIFFAIYMLIDMPRVLRSVRRLVPPKYHDELGVLGGQVSYVAGGYFRAQVVTAIIFGTVVTLGLWALGLPAALTMGLMAMVLRLIPTLGAIMAGSASFVVALLQGSVRFPDMSHFFFALIVAALFVVMLQIDDYVVQPRIVGKRVSLPGLFVLMGVATGTAIAGVLGAYLAVPTLAAFRVIFLYVHGKVTEGTVALPEAETEPEVTAPSEAAG
jgi:predicted PurR-regulated permease PerM